MAADKAEVWLASGLGIAGGGRLWAAVGRVMDDWTPPSEL